MTDILSLPPSCPIYGDVAAISGLSRDMRRQLRKLKRDLQACDSCAQMDNGHCPFLDSFQSQVNAAITAVTEEWNLAVSD